jgi:hypothetical protein
VKYTRAECVVVARDALCGHGWPKWCIDVEMNVEGGCWDIREVLGRERKGKMSWSSFFFFFFFEMSVRENVIIVISGDGYVAE